MPMSLHIDIEEIDRKIILRLDGRLDAATCSILERKLISLEGERHVQLLLDFTDVDYLSSAALRLLLAEAKKLKAKKGALVIFSVNEEVMEVIKMVGFDKILPIFENEQDALRYIRFKAFKTGQEMRQIQLG